MTDTQRWNLFHYLSLQVAQKYLPDGNYTASWNMSSIWSIRKNEALPLIEGEKE